MASWAAALFARRRLFRSGLLGADTVAENAFQTDLAKANELWAASGNGPTELTLTYGAGQFAPGGLSRDVLSAKLQADIQGIEGVTVKLLPMDPTQRLADYPCRASCSSPCRTGRRTTPMCTPTRSRSGQPVARQPSGVAYSNPEVDELLDKGIAQTDEAEREATYVQIQEILQDDSAFIVEFPAELCRAGCGQR